MDIIFTLPFPKEICSQIFIYTCKSEHNSLGINVLKHFTNTDSEDILDTNLLQITIHYLLHLFHQNISLLTL